MGSSHRNEVYNFLATKMLFAKQQEQEEILLFWADLIVGEFERDTLAAAGLDSEDKDRLRANLNAWFRRTLAEFIFDLHKSGAEMNECANQVKARVLSGVRHITRDLFFGKRPRNRDHRQKTKSGKAINQAGPSPLQEGLSCRQNLFVSHLNPDMQETVFVDVLSDAETQYLFKELLGENEGEQPEEIDGEFVGFFSNKQTHMETLRARLANSRV